MHLHSSSVPPPPGSVGSSEQFPLLNSVFFCFFREARVRPRGCECVGETPTLYMCVPAAPLVQVGGCM